MFTSLTTELFLLYPFFLKCHSNELRERLIPGFFAQIPPFLALYLLAGHCQQKENPVQISFYRNLHTEHAVNGNAPKHADHRVSGRRLTKNYFPKGHINTFQWWVEFSLKEYRRFQQTQRILQSVGTHQIQAVSSLGKIDSQFTELMKPCLQSHISSSPDIFETLSYDWPRQFDIVEFVLIKKILNSVC